MNMNKHNVLIATVICCLLLLANTGNPSHQSNTYAQTQAQQSNARFFPETKHTVKGRFLQYWDQNGGLLQQGYPKCDEMQEVSQTDGKTYTMQYFERAVFEYRPENQPPNDVLLSLLGVFQYRQKYPNGAPAQTINTDSPYKFTETGYTVGGKFRAYWESHGGLAQEGYPISEEFQEKSDLDGKVYTVQYFERAVFEYHPENAGTLYEVLLSQLGTFEYKALHGIQTPSVPDPVAGHVRSDLRGSDRYLIWRENIHSSASSKTPGIMGLDLKTNKTFVIVDDANNQHSPQVTHYQADAQISGSLVVWQDHYCDTSACILQIRGEDLATGATYQIASGTEEYSPAVARRTVVWLEGNGTSGYGNLVAKDVDTNRVVRITSVPMDVSAIGYPQASDEYIVWSQKGPVDKATNTVPMQLLAYERKTGKTISVAQLNVPDTGGNESILYALSDHRLVWGHALDPNMTDLSTRKTSILKISPRSMPVDRSDILIWGANVVDLKEGSIWILGLGSNATEPTIAGDWFAFLNRDQAHINFKLISEALASP